MGKLGQHFYSTRYLFIRVNSFYGHVVITSVKDFLIQKSNNFMCAFRIIMTRDDCKPVV